MSSWASSKWGQEDIQNLKDYILNRAQKVFKKDNAPDVLCLNIFLDFDIYNTSNRKEVYEEFKSFIEQESNNIKIFFIPTLKFDYDKDKPTLIETGIENSICED
jgi:ribosome-binding factor A